MTVTNFIFGIVLYLFHKKLMPIAMRKSGVMYIGSAQRSQCKDKTLRQIQ